MNQYPGMPHVGAVYPTQPPRRQDPHYAASPHPHYVPFYAPSSPHPGPVPYGPPPQYIPQWYPYPQYSYPVPPQPRHYSHQSPLVVSSTASQPIYPTSRHQPQQHQQQPPPARTPLPDQSTPSTASQPIASSSTTPITNSDTTATPPILPSKTTPDISGVDDSQQRKPFSLQLPWYSVPESSFPPRMPRRRRKRRSQDLLSATPSLPSFPRQRSSPPDVHEQALSETVSQSASLASAQTSSLDAPTSLDQLSEETPPHADATPSTVLSDASATPIQRKRAPTRPVVPAIPNLPRRPGPNAAATPVPIVQQLPNNEVQQMSEHDVKQQQAQSSSESAQSPDTATSSPKRAPPKSWAELLRTKDSASQGTTAALSSTANGVATNSARTASSGSLPDTLRTYDVGNAGKISFLEPRGLVNTGNMCYMNSILQVLLFCVPFFELLDLIRKRAVHSFKSNTPLLDAMIMFMNEYNIIDSAPSVEQLRLRLKDNELEQFGESFIPEYVYDAIKHIPRFSSMRRGQQQDAEEFLGLMLEVLHLECITLMDKIDQNSTTAHVQPNGVHESSQTGEVAGPDGSDGWTEVHRHQKPAVTRSSGASTTSPFTKIFGGSLRSEFRVPGSKNSVTLTPYQQLQLDINDPSVTNITHALQGLARSEKIEGQFATPRGVASHGIKQVFIEDLPPMLILHLKRFEYDSKLGSTQKVWKKVGYPLDLEIPKEVFSSSKRLNYTSRPEGFPKYRLSAVVYHHGKYAGGGHYTVDVRRQEGREWIRLDDTIIRRESAEDVAREGGEEDPSLLAAALERHNQQHQSGATSKASNPYTITSDENDSTLVDGDNAGSEGWSQVNSNGVTSPPSSSSGNKKWSGIVTNGNTNQNTGGSATPTGKQTPRGSRGIATNGKGVPTSSKDKVAYILFYERVHG